MAYEWDVFLSYPRADPIGPWVQDYFHPLLERWLPTATKHQPRIFLDKQMEAGTRWPANLKDALLKSKCLVAVWSPHYFRSRWCMAEWQTMLKREQLLGLGQGAAPGLVFPFTFADGDVFPQEAKNTTVVKDFRPYNLVQPGFRRTSKYRKLEQEIQASCDPLGKWLPLAPDWDANWPFVEPEPMPEAKQELLRLQ